MTMDPFNATTNTLRPASTSQSTPSTTQTPTSRNPSTSGTEESKTQPRTAAGATANHTGADSRRPEERTEQVAQAVERINEMMQNGQQSLRFAVDEDSGRTVVRVLDAHTEEVIRQIPSEETLRFAEYVDGLVGMIFNKKA